MPTPSPARVLIIEDHSDLAANLYDYLEAKGHQPDTAGDGLTELHLAVTNDYGVIIMDIMIPGMDGLTACRKLREEAGCTTPVLMLTARDTLDDKLAGFDVADLSFNPNTLEVHRQGKIDQRRYAQGSTPFALAVSISEYRLAPAFTPLTEALNSQFLRPTTNGLIAFSTPLLSISRRPSSR